jgi:hypothetical protein
MTEVLFHGEYVDKDLLNRWLQNPENQRKVEELEAQAEEQEQRKQLQKQKRAETQLREKKVQEYLQKYHQESPGEWSDEFAKRQWQRAYNEYDYDLQHEE